MAATSDSPFRLILRRLEAIEEQIPLRVPAACLVKGEEVTTGSVLHDLPSGFSNKGLCWYHATFGANARQCRSLCQWMGNEYRGGK